jgi:hypothetical protein
MAHIDYLGAQGGALALAFAQGCVVTTTALLGAGWFLWKLLFNPRLKELNERLEGERIMARDAMREERDQCSRQIEQLRDRIVQLETMLSLHGNPALKQAINAWMAGNQDRE